VIDEMRRKFPHLQREVTRHDKVVWYVRVDRGPRVRLHQEPGSKEFFAEYQQALISGAPQQEDKSIRKAGSIGWLIKEYMKSGDWTRLAKETRKQLSYQLKRVDDNSGTKPYAALTRAHIIEGQDRRRQTPSDANKFIKAMRKLFKFAVAKNHVKRNPTDGVEFLKLPNKEIGFHTWTEEEIEKFEAHWAVGTRERLAFDILLYTGLRRGDAVTLGRQHIKDGIASIRASKNGETVTIPILPPLFRSIEATKTGDLSLLVTAYGRPFDKAGFGNWFRYTCKEAGVPGSAHGLRKAGAVRAAEAGASESQLNAIFGWREGSRESATYTRKARRAKLSKESAKLLLLNKSSRTDEKVRENE
jgi:integrase